MDRIEVVSIEKIIIGERRRKVLGDLTDLAASIRAIGLIQPVILDDCNRLVSGQRRLEAVKSIGDISILCRICGSFNALDAALRAERDENTCRQPLLPSEAAELGLAIADAEKTFAQERREKSKFKKEAEHSKTAFLANPAVGAQRPDRETLKTREAGAKAAGMSPHTFAKAVEVITAPVPDDVKKSIIAKMDTTGNVAQAHRETRAAQGKTAEPVKRRTTVAGPIQASGSVWDAIGTKAPPKPENAATTTKSGTNKGLESVPESAPVYDMEHVHILNPELRKVFTDGRADFNECLSHLNHLKTAISKIIGRFDVDKVTGKQVWTIPITVHGQGLAVDRSNLREHLSQIDNILRCQMPHSVCLESHPQGEQCDKCHTAGWITKQQHRNLTLHR